MQKRPSRPEMYAQRKKYYIARGLKVGSANLTGMYHPHFHVLLMVKPSFFTGKRLCETGAMGRGLAGLHEAGLHATSRHSGIKPNKRATEESAADAAMTAAIRDDEISDQARQLKTGCGGKHEPAGTRRTSRSGHLPVSRHEGAAPRLLAARY